MKYEIGDALRLAAKAARHIHRRVLLRSEVAEILVYGSMARGEDFVGDVDMMIFDDGAFSHYEVPSPYVSVSPTTRPGFLSEDSGAFWVGSGSRPLTTSHQASFRVAPLPGRKRKISRKSWIFPPTSTFYPSMSSPSRR